MSSHSSTQNELRVIDGDDIAWREQLYRLAGYDTPETLDLRSKIDQYLERRRGQLAKLRLETLIAGARSIYLIDWETTLGSGGRRLATLLVDGQDVAAIALREGWGIDFRDRNAIDWGDHDLWFYGIPPPTNYRQLATNPLSPGPDRSSSGGGAKP